MSAALDLASGSLWLDQAVGHHVDGELNRLEAEAVTAKIKAYVGVTWILIAEAHSRRADKALGYSSWAEYVETEFDMSRAHAYRLIAHAQAVYELAGAAGLDDVSPIGDIPEGATRAADLAAVAAEVEEQVALLGESASDEDRAEVVRAAVQTHTTKTTVEETTSTTFDPETGEILSPTGDDENPTQQEPGDDGSDSDGDAAPSGDGADSHDVGRTDPEPGPDTSGEEGSGSRSTPPVDPILGYRATASRFKAQTRSSLLTLDPERVIATSDDPKAWADLAADLRSFADQIDKALAGPRLRVVL